MTTHQPTVITNDNLYDQDFYLWIETISKQLKAGKFAEIDLANLIEEIESMGKSEKRELKSRLIVLLMHLLKWQYQPEKRSESWRSTITEQRICIELLLNLNLRLIFIQFKLNLFNFFFLLNFKFNLKQHLI